MVGYVSRGARIPLAGLVFVLVVLSGTASATEVTIQGDAFCIDGVPTYQGITWQGHPIEGLLFNARMVQGIFDDLNSGTVGNWAYPDTGVWDADRNTREFVDAMDEWRSHGLLAFTVNLQGGCPYGYCGDQPWINSALAADGSLRPAYMERLRLILDRADELGMVAILGIFYFGQDQRLTDESAVLAGVDNVVEWVLANGYGNVLIEINNECDIHYDHAILQAHRVHEVVQRAKAFTRDGRRLLVGTSFCGGQIPTDAVVAASDFVLLHGNGVSNPSRISAMVQQVRSLPSYTAKPILFNEDDHFNFDRVNNNMVAALSSYASWGFFDPGQNNYQDGYQSVPVNWGINTSTKRAFFDMLYNVTTGQSIAGAFVPTSAGACGAGLASVVLLVWSLQISRSRPTYRKRR